MADAEIVRLARVLHPVTVLGPGRRVGIWVQGCTLACPGCVSQDTWDPGAGLDMEPVDLVALLEGILAADPALTGITVTGGEPFQQPLLGPILREVLAAHSGRVLDVLVYTGYAARSARRRAPDLWSVADAVIVGRYQQDRPWPGPWAGSDNQTLITLTDLGRDRLGTEHWPKGPGLQAVMADGDLVMVGIPRPGELDQLQDRLSDNGIHLQGVSWRS